MSSVITYGMHLSFKTMSVRSHLSEVVKSSRRDQGREL